MWKPEEEDVEDQLGAEQAEGELDDPGDHEGSMKTDGFPLRPIIFHFIFISFLFQDTNFSLNCKIDFDQFEKTFDDKPHYQMLNRRVRVLEPRT